MAKPIRVVHQENDFTPLPEGTYDCKIIKVEQSTSSKGNPQLEVSLEVVEGPKQGRKPKKWYSMTEKAGWALRKLVEELDVAFTDHGKTPDGQLDWEFDADDLVGRIVRYDVTIRTHEGKKNNDFSNEQVSEFDPYYAELMKEREEATGGGESASETTTAPAAAATAAAAAPPAQARRRTPATAARR